MSTSDLSWLKQLPTFPYLPQESPSIASTLIKPFSLFSLFRSASTLPPSKLLAGLQSLASEPPSDYSKPNLRGEVLRAVQDFHAYVARVQQASDDERNATALEERLNEVAKGYLGCFYVSVPTATSSSHPQSGVLRRVVQDSLRALFILHDHLPLSHNVISETLDRHILASCFPPASNYHLLTPLFAIARSMVDTLSLTTRNSKAKSEIMASVAEDDALFIYELLRTASREIKGLSGSGPEGKTKASKHDARRRALRLGMELDVWRAELAFAMINANMTAVKARAGEVEAGQGAQTEEGQDPEMEEDVKPKLDPEDDEISLPDVSTNSAPEIKLELNDGITPSIKWEDLTEETLVTLLQEARGLVEEGYSCVLSDKVERGDWLSHLPEEIPLPSTPTRRSKSLSTSADADTDAIDDEESEFDESSSEISEELEETYTCPLRSLFSLYDRFEEQRLAVWTSLPQSANAHKGRRKEMETYMRGTNGVAGEAGEALGLVLLIEYDRQALIGFGLSYDKLDKWLELASNRNAKKIKRRKPAAAPTRGKAPAKRGGHRKTGSVASVASATSLSLPPAMRTRGRSKTPASSVAASARGEAPKRGRKAKRAGSVEL